MQFLGQRRSGTSQHNDLTVDITEQKDMKADGEVIDTSRKTAPGGNLKFIRKNTQIKTSPAHRVSCSKKC